MLKRQKCVPFSRKGSAVGISLREKLLGEVAWDSRTHSPTMPEEGLSVKEKSHGPGALQALFSKKAEMDPSPLKLVR